MEKEQPHQSTKEMVITREIPLRRGRKADKKIFDFKGTSER